VYQNGIHRCACPAAAIFLRPVPSPTSRAVRRTAPPRSPRPNGGSPPDGATPDSVSRVYQELHQLIVSGQLPPGARIAERVVADRLGLSRTPVRSALHRLQQEGFVDSYGRGGDQRLVVTPLTQDDGREIMLIVGHLEGLAARTAAQLPPAKRAAVVRRLRQVNKVMAAESRKRVTVSRIFDLDQAFHSGYVNDVIGPRLLALHSAIKPQVERYSRLYISSLVDELPVSVREHEVIIRAIAAGNPDAAQSAVETNWRNAAGRLTKVIAEHGERGIWHAWDTNGPLAPARPRGPRTVSP
jgi:DNA-binding GntR family transcriptional regulator